MSEQTQARMPGFGKKLFTFLEPLFKGAPDGRMRLIKAACLLHDTTWRAHPDFRAEACFDNATRANLGGLDHPGRVFLGLALLHRYNQDSRDQGRAERLPIMNSEEGVWSCTFVGYCSKVCPKGVDPAAAINQGKVESLSDYALNLVGLSAAATPAKPCGGE